MKKTSKAKHRDSKKKRNKLLFQDINTYEENQFLQKDQIELQDNLTKSTKFTENGLVNEINEEDDEKVEEALTEHDKISQLVQQMLLKNKINLKNVFDIPLPDVSQMSDFQSNYQINNIYLKKKVQSNFLENNYHQLLNQVQRFLEIGEEADENLNNITNLSDAQQIIDNQIRKQELGKKKMQKNGEGNLEKNVNNITLEHYDFQFSVDPLFQKTSQKFDESGAKGLLLNNIQVAFTNQIDDQLNMMFDSNNILEQKGNFILKRKTLKKKSQKQDEKALQKQADQIMKFLPEQDYFIKGQLCPEFAKFRHELLDRSKEIFDLSMTSFAKNDNDDDDLQFPLEEQVLYDDNNYLEDIETKLQNFEMLLPTEEQQQQNFLDFNFNTQTEDNNFTEFENNLSESTSQQAPTQFNFSFINEQIQKIGQGSSAICKISLFIILKRNVDEQCLNGSRIMKQGKTTKQSKSNKDKPLEIDFNLKIKENLTTLFTDNTSKSKITKSYSSAPSQLYLQMRDYQIHPKRHLHTFLRQAQKTTVQSKQKEGEEKGIVKEEYNNNEVYEVRDEQQFMESQQQENWNYQQKHETLDDQQEGFIKNVFLEGKGPSANNYPIRKLKVEIWNEINSIVQDNTHKLSFSEVLKLMKEIKRKQNKNLSIQACFITLLHLANENDLSFEQIDDNPDFIISKAVTG